MDLIPEFDDLTRCYQVILNNFYENEFIDYIEKQDEFHLKWIELNDECKRLNIALNAAKKDCSTLDSKLSSARRLLDFERQQRKKLENEKNGLANIFEELRRILFNDPRYKLPEETKEKIASFSKTIHDSNSRRLRYDLLNTITESDSTASDVNISYSRSEDDLDETNKRARCRPSYLEEVSVRIKKRRSECVSAVPTAPEVESLESSSADPISEKSIDEICKENVVPVFNQINDRPHNFIVKSGFREQCLPCKQKIGLFKTAFKCMECNAFAHPECRNKVPLPCVPMSAPLKCNTMGIVSDYAPSFPPMIPALVVHCINEVEQRGLEDIGIYRIPGVDREVRSLKDKFLECRGVPSLSEVDIYTVCGCLKDFLRTLQDSLIPHSKWSLFAEALQKSDQVNKFDRAVSSLHQANRDTLAFIILHLQRVSNSSKCKMPLSNLASIFGPIIVGRPSTKESNLFEEARISNIIMEELLKLAPEYWNNFITDTSTPRTPSTLPKTPSTNSLMRKTPRKFLTTPRSRKRFFNTSPQTQQNG